MTAHVFEQTGHGPKGTDPGCSCGIPMTADVHEFHKFMRAYFAANPLFGRLGAYKFRFAHWPECHTPPVH